MASEQSRYRVESVLGRGGMGTVERALDTATGRAVALKRLLLANADGDRKRRMIGLFEREYRVLSQLAHPGIVEVYDYGVDDGGPYYTMELLDGDDVAKHAPLPWQKACSLIRDVASSLAIIHARGFVHRDVTPMNVRCTSDGRAKLLDFGAMCTMGMVENLVGTPPFVPPEALHRGTLDGRADLFALGASLYYLMTGRHAYPARNLDQLRQLWQVPLPSPKMLCEDVPNGLDRLVMQLLSTDAVARPTSAGQVYEELSGIAGLARSEQGAVAKAYLHTPSLLGREPVLRRCMGRLSKAATGQGSSLLLSGEVGAGRSRLLATLKLEAQLSGATVLSSDAAIAQIGDFALLKRLASQLLITHEEARELVDDGQLARFLKSFQLSIPAPPVSWRPDASRPPAASTPRFERSTLLSAFTAWLCKVSQRRCLVVAIDDLQALDEPSLALIASLASGLTRARILLIATLERGTQTRSEVAISLVSAQSTVIDVEPLSEADAHTMLASMFGDAPNLSVLSTVLFRVCRGNPSTTVQRAQDLVDARVVRYEAGLWMIPNQPVDLEQIVLRPDGVMERLQALSDDARELVHLLALDRDGRLRRSDLTALTAHGQDARVEAALQALVRAKIVVTVADGFAFARPNYAIEIVHSIEPSRQKRLHELLAQRLADKPKYRLTYLHHLALADDVAAAHYTKHEVISPTWSIDMFEARYLTDTLEEVLALCHRTGATSGTVAIVRAGLLGVAAGRVEWERVRDHAQAALADFTHYSGLDDYHRLHDVPEPERLTQALAAANARYEQTPEQERGFSVEKAMEQLATAVLSLSSASWSLLDRDLLQRVPSLAPFFPLSPALRIIDAVRCAIDDIMHGALLRAWRSFRTLHAELEAGVKGVAAGVHTQLYGVVLGFNQGIDASMGVSAVLERTKRVETSSKRLAESQRYGYYLAIGDVQGATLARKRMELLQVQGGVTRHDPTHWGAELTTYMSFRDVVGLKHCINEAERMQRTRPGWDVRRKLAQAAYNMMCGAADQAQAELEALLQEVPRDHAECTSIMGHYLFVLNSRGRYDQVKQLGTAFLSDHPHAYPYGLMIQIAEAELRSGDQAGARLRMLECIEGIKAWDMRGVILGNAYEQLARIALQAEDQVSFQQYAALCAEQFKAGRNPGLTARYQALMRTAREHEITVNAALEKAAQYTAHANANELIQKLQTQVGTQMQAADRYQIALRMMIQSSAAEGGFLYVAGSEGLRLVASEGGLAPDEILEADVKHFWTIEVVSKADDRSPLGKQEPEERTVTHTHNSTAATLEPVSAAQPRFVAGERALVPLVLVDRHVDQARPCGMLVLVPPEQAAWKVPGPMLDAFARVLAVAAAHSAAAGTGASLG